MDIANELLYAFRVFLAAVLGGIIGWERERSDSDAGIRTYMATSMGACATLLLQHLPGWRQFTGKRAERESSGQVPPSDHG